jgi:hypothetical protein
MMRWGFATRGIREEAAMNEIMFMNINTVLRRMLDAFVSAWMRQTAAAAEQARTRTPGHR